MRHALVLAVVLAASTAAAQPRPPCAVTIARAPDAVRTVIEQFVAAEASCSVKLEVRVVPTEGGLYLLARDDSGRVRERVVPDAQSAGVLVASWVAADSNTAPVVAPAPLPAPVVAPAGPPGAMVAPAPMVAPQPMPPVAPPQAIGPVEAAQPPSEAPVVAPALVEKSR